MTSGSISAIRRAMPSIVGHRHPLMAGLAQARLDDRGADAIFVYHENGQTRRRHCATIGNAPLFCNAAFLTAQSGTVPVRPNNQGEWIDRELQRPAPGQVARGGIFDTPAGSKTMIAALLLFSRQSSDTRERGCF